MDIMTYKGRTIRVSEQKSEDYRRRFLAEDMTGSNSAYGESVDDAVNQLKQRIDNIPKWKSLYQHEKTAEELGRLTRMLESENEAFFLKQHLKKNHFIIANKNNWDLDNNDIQFHSEVIENVLKEKGYSFQLRPYEIYPDFGQPFFILYDAEWCDNDNKLADLVNRALEQYN